MKKVLVSVTNDLVTDQRVAKVCNVLSEMNFEVELIGRKLPNSLPVNRSYKTHRMQLLFTKGFLFYAEYNVRLFFRLLFSKGNILLANDLDTLLPNFLVSRILRRKLVFDSHELFSEIPELIDRKKVKGFWKQLEEYMIPRLKNCYTVSQSIADYYKENYNNVNFKVVRNVPTITKIDKEETKSNETRTIIYQGSLNVGRGLELMISAMQYLDDVKLYIVGEGDIAKELKQKVETLHLVDQVQFIGKVTPNKLKLLTVNSDLGISLEEDLGLNYRYALPNKLFDYIHARIPVLISDLPEMKKIVLKHKVGDVLIRRDPVNLAKQIRFILDQDKNRWSAALDNAIKDLNWDKESLILKNIFKHLN